MPVTLITGPPCAGKTTYARSLAQPGDILLDFDDICVEVGGSHQWAHSTRTKEAAEAVMRQRMAMVRAYPSHPDSYVIRCAPESRAREALARYLGAVSVVVVDPGIDVCLSRAFGRPRGTTHAIRDWYRRFTPAPCDTAPTITSREWP
jgi:predicted kinase